DSDGRPRHPLARGGANGPTQTCPSLVHWMWFVEEAWLGDWKIGRQVANCLEFPKDNEGEVNDLPRLSSKVRANQDLGSRLGHGRITTPRLRCASDPSARVGGSCGRFARGKLEVAEVRPDDRGGVRAAR